MDLAPDVQQALQTWAHLTCTLAGVVDFLRERMAASGVRSRNDFAPYRQGAMDAVMAGGDAKLAAETGACDERAYKIRGLFSHDESLCRRLVYKLERDLFPDDINCHVCSIADMATPRLPYRTAGGETAESHPKLDSHSVAKDRNIDPPSSSLSCASHGISGAAYSAVARSGFGERMRSIESKNGHPLGYEGSSDYRRAGITLDSLPDELVVDMLRGFLRGQLLGLRCVSHRWDSLVVTAVSLNSSLRVKQLPLVVPSGYGGKLELDLKDSTILDGDNDRIMSRLLFWNTNVTSLNFHGALRSADSLRVLGEVLRINSSITSLSLGNNRINGDGAKILSDVLDVNTSITSIALEQNRIGDAGLLSIADSLRVNDRITRLCLNRNNISDAGVVGLCEALTINTRLTYLNLSKISIGDAAFQALSGLLETSTNISWLSLSENHMVDDDGARRLCEALRLNTSLTHLDLSNNQISDVSAVALGEALRVNTILTSLLLGRNRFSNVGLQSLREALRENSTLTFLQLKMENGDGYYGQWFINERHGQGTCTCAKSAGNPGILSTQERFILANGIVYSGFWRNDKRHGHGTMRFPDGKVYEGAWERDCMHGRGTMQYLDGNIYVGLWMLGKRHGQGILKCMNKCVYEGAWKDDKMNGHGIWRTPDGVVYDGTWKDDKMNGYGTIKLPCGGVYEGEWQDGDINGQGIWRYSNGDVYEGAWKNDKRHGQGKLKYAEGSEYEGAWECGLKNGHGTYIFSNGNQYIGAFVADLLTEGIFKFADSDKEYHTVFERREDKKSDDDDGWSVYWAVLRDASAGGAVYREGFFSRGDFEA